MKAAFVFLFSFAATASGWTDTQSMAAKINSLAGTWKASAGTATAQMTQDQFRALINPRYHRGNKGVETRTHSAAERAAAPESFDSREAWPQCASMRQIRDQSQCGSCWAFASVEAMSDRTCVKYGYDVILSAEDMLACSNGGDCSGGSEVFAYKYWIKNGVVTEKCRGYSLPSCDRSYLRNITRPCPNTTYQAPQCVRNCTDVGLSWDREKWRGKRAYAVFGEADMMAEIAANGPITAAFFVYDDFRYYESGVYKHVTGQGIGGHSVKIIGYGTDANGTKFWMVANSWNEGWGEGGFFRMLRGKNECGIESDTLCGDPN